MVTVFKLRYVFYLKKNVVTRLENFVGLDRTLKFLSQIGSVEQPPKILLESISTLKEIKYTRFSIVIGAIIIVFA